MKKIFYTLIVVFAISACSKKKDDPAPSPSTPTFTPAMTAKVDGVDLNLLTPSTKCYGHKPNFDIQGGNSTANTQVILFLSDIIPGNYTAFGVGSPNYCRIITSTNNYSTGYNTYTSGTISVSSCDTVNNRISGSFSCVAKDSSSLPIKSITVTNGIFKDLPLQIW